MRFGIRKGGHDSAKDVLDERDRFAALLECMDVAVVSCAQDGRLTYMNPRAREVLGVDCALGSTPATWIESCGLRSPIGALYEPHALPVMQALDGQTIRGVDLLASGRTGDVLLTASAGPVFDSDGIQAGAVVAFEDVTEQRARDSAIRRELGNAGLVLDVQEAIDSGRLLLYAQPIVDIHSGETVVEELLLRLRAADGTISSPTDFLAAAERFGTITAVDRWVFDQAARLAAGGRPVAVNISGTSVSTPSFLADAEATLARYEIDPSLLTIEITETAVVSDIEQVSRFAEEIERLGCHFALDDFGTGYAALTYLKHLPIRYLKIDIDFIRDLSLDSRSRGVVSGIVAFAESLNQRTIAEGVETEATLDVLRELRVDLAQGFGVGEPAPVGAG